MLRTLFHTLRQRLWFRDARSASNPVAARSNGGGLVNAHIETPAVARYLEKGLCAVEGWGINDMLGLVFICFDNFQKQHGIGGNMLEIGVHHGRSAILLALMSRPQEVSIFLDLFDRQHENMSDSGKGDREIFEKNIADWAPRCKIEIIQANTLTYDFGSNSRISDGIRFAHIDGAHDKAAVLNDIAKVQRYLIDGGVVIIDDFWHSGFPEVNEACNEYLSTFPGERLVPIASGMNKLILTTPSYADRYLGFLAPRLHFPVGKRVRCHNHPVYCLDGHH